MTGYTKLFGSIVASTIWREDNETRVVWITMLAMADRDGVVDASVPGLADMARVPIEATRKALEKFMSPDPDSRTDEHEGRRVKKVDGGWLLLNHAKYRHKMSLDERREYQKLKQREYRGKRKGSENNGNAQPLPVTQPEDRPVTRQPSFTKPTLEEAMLHASKRGLPQSEVEKFLSFYESKGWKVGKSPMKDWRAAMNGWAVRWEESGRGRNGNTAQPQVSPFTRKKALEDMIQNHCMNGAGPNFWRTSRQPDPGESGRQEYERLKAELQQLNREMAG